MEARQAGGQTAIWRMFVSTVDRQRGMVRRGAAVLQLRIVRIQQNANVEEFLLAEEPKIVHATAVMFQYQT